MTHPLTRPPPTPVWVYLAPAVVTLLTATAVLTAQEPIKVEQTGSFNLYLGLGLAAVALIQTISVAVVSGIISSRKEKRDAERLIAAAKAAALLKSEEKQEDWRRQDEVAKRAAETAKQLIETQQAAVKRQDEVANRVAEAAQATATTADLLAKAQHETIARTDEVARVAAAAGARVQTQLVELHEQGRTIHGLVDGEMTTARTNERDSLRLLTISLRNSLALSKQLGIQPMPGEEEEIKRTEKRIEELDKILAERHAAQKKINQAAASTATADMRRSSDVLAAATEQTQAVLSGIEDNTAQIAANTEPPVATKAPPS